MNTEITYRAVDRGVTWSVYANGTPLLHNLDKWQAKVIAVVLSKGEDVYSPPELDEKFTQP